MLGVFFQETNIMPELSLFSQTYLFRPHTLHTFMEVTWQSKRGLQWVWAHRMCRLRFAAGPRSAPRRGTAPAPPGPAARSGPTPCPAPLASGIQPSCCWTRHPSLGLEAGLFCCGFFFFFGCCLLGFFKWNSCNAANVFVHARSTEQILHMVCYAKGLETASSLSWLQCKFRRV